MAGVDIDKETPQLRRVLRLRDLVIYGLVIIQPTAPMPVFGVVSREARGHVVSAVLLAMAAMLPTAISYGRMARAYPSAGSAYTYVSRALHPWLGYLAGWSIILDYLLNPTICAIWCSKAAANFVPIIPSWLFAIFFVLLFTALNLRGIEASARVNFWTTILLTAAVALFLVFAGRYLLAHPHLTARDLLLPFYNPATFSFGALSRGSAIAVLTYIGFDSVSTLSEEAENPRRNIMIATLLTCLITGVLASLEVYTAQLIWPDYGSFPDLDTAFVYVAQRAGGPWLFVLLNAALLVATIGSGFGAQLGAARLLYGMGRDGAVPQRLFGVVDPISRVPRNGVLFSGALALVGSSLMSYQLGAELLNFGAFIAFMGVNAASLAHYCVKHRQRSWRDWFPPAAGFAVCFYIWLNLGVAAKVAGGLWLAGGVAYGAIRGLPKALDGE